MLALINEIRPYAWGSRTAMAEFLGAPSPSPEPQAELWIGAYPGFSSRVADGRSLSDLIAEDPNASLGTEVAARFGARLPFLMKVLTIGAPLSLQAHPNAEQAAAGFAVEEAAGVPLDHPSRNYRDPRHKPEMLCALTPVEAFCGLRRAPEAVILVDALAVTELASLRDALSGEALSDAVQWVFDLPDAEVTGTVSAVGKAAGTVGTGPHVPALQWISGLAQKYPDDRGVLLTLLCTFIRLEPGEALVIPAGCLHAYLSGVGVEIMAASDNVLRGGLTAKHVDVVDLQGVLDLNGDGPKLLRGVPDSTGRTSFPTEVAEFDLIRRSITDAVVLEGSRPRLILTVDGSARLSSPDGTVLDLPRGAAAFVSAAEHGIEISGPAVVFEASTGQSPPSDS